MKRILSTIYLPDEIVAKYSDKFILEYPGEGRFSPEELNDKLRGADGFLGGPLTKPMIDIAAKLQIACSFGAGYDAIDHEYAGKKGIWVMNAPYATTEPTAELTVTLILCLSRRILNFYKFMKNRGSVGGTTSFADAFDDAQPPTPVHGKTLGIVGFGKIGKLVAKKAQGLGMSVIYHDIIRTPESLEKELGVKYVSFEELLKTADYVSLHCMYTPENHHMMGAAQFKLMKPTAYFINAARGKLMDEQALIDALNNNRIRGAALDVYEFEPQVTAELFEMDSVLLTPHIGTLTRESRLNMAKEALDGIIAHLDGGKSPTIVNKEFYIAK